MFTALWNRFVSIKAYNIQLFIYNFFHAFQRTAILPSDEISYVKSYNVYQAQCYQLFENLN